MIVFMVLLLADANVLIVIIVFIRFIQFSRERKTMAFKSARDLSL